jgi:hypothetical protein
MQNQGQFVSSFRVRGKFLPRENPVCATFPRGEGGGDLRTLIIPYYTLLFHIFLISLTGGSYEMSCTFFLFFLRIGML